MGSVVNLHWFQCGSGSSIVLGHWEYGSGSRDLTTKNVMFYKENNHIFVSLKIILSLWRTCKLQEKPAAHKIEYQHFKTIHFFTFFFLFCCSFLLDWNRIRICIPNADLDPADQLRIRIHNTGDGNWNRTLASYLTISPQDRHWSIISLPRPTSAELSTCIPPYFPLLFLCICLHFLLEVWIPTQSFFNFW